MQRLAFAASLLRAPDYVCLSCRTALFARQCVAPPALQHRLSSVRRFASSPQLNKSNPGQRTRARRRRRKAAREALDKPSAPAIRRVKASSRDDATTSAPSPQVGSGAVKSKNQGASSQVSPARKGQSNRRRRRSLKKKPKSPKYGLPGMLAAEAEGVAPKEAGGRRLSEVLETSIESMGSSLRSVLGKGVADAADVQVQSGSDLGLEVIPVEQPPVPRLAHGLDRVLFNPGVMQFRDTRSGVYNVDPQLEKLMPINEFDFNSLTLFTPPSRDHVLARIARESKKKYIASTSSMTGILKHFHFLLSNFRPLDFSALSKSFPKPSAQATKLSMAPDAIFLRWKGGVYAVDADKEFDSANVLSLMGRYMEKLLTLDLDAFQRHRIDAENPITEQERSEPEAYHYSTQGDFLLRSQLDAYDGRLPGTGMFDLKTRAVAPIRMDSGDFYWGMDYEIQQLHGEWQSFEREYHDMVRSTMLKYSLQARMGRMDGIFVAFHNIARMFGFQYISLEEMDAALHGQSNRDLGDVEFLHSLKLVNEIFDRATAEFPEKSIRFHFEFREGRNNFMYIFAEPFEETEVEAIQNKSKAKIQAWEKKILAGETISETERVDGEEEPSSATGDAAASTQKQEMSSSLLDDSHQTMPADAEPDEVVDAISHSSSGEGSPETTATADEVAAAANVMPEVSADEVPVDSITDPHETSVTDGKDKRSTPKTRKARVMQELNDQRPKEKQFLGFALEVRSEIDGEAVRRPTGYDRRSTWNLKYKLMEITNQDRLWSLYVACKQRRFLEFNREEREASEHADMFMENLRMLARESREWREALDARESESGAAKRMWNEVQPATTSTAAKAKSTQQTPLLKDKQAPLSKDKQTPLLKDKQTASLKDNQQPTEQLSTMANAEWVSAETRQKFLAQVRSMLIAHYSNDSAFAAAVGKAWLAARLSNADPFARWAQGFLSMQRLLHGGPVEGIAAQCAFLAVKLARDQTGVKGELNMRDFAAGKTCQSKY